MWHAARVLLNRLLNMRGYEVEAIDLRGGKSKHQCLDLQMPGIPFSDFDALTSITTIDTSGLVA